MQEIEESGKADDEAVDFAEGLEAEDFGGVVGYSSVVKGAVCNYDSALG